MVNLLEAGKRFEAAGTAAAKEKKSEQAKKHFLDAERRYEQAVRIWGFLETSTPDGRAIKRIVGYPLFDELMGIGVDVLAKRVLAELIESARAEIDQEAPEGSEISWMERADALNNLAWFLALDGQQLTEALACAEAAVALVRDPRAKGPLPFADGQRRVLESAYLNTLGWVQFLIAEETDLALKNLREATELEPLGPNFLYLGMAYASLGDERAAIEALRSAEEAGGLSPREERLFREAKAEMGL
jgi:tetratricopeptide (TPR) repeat protein